MGSALLFVFLIIYLIVKASSKNTKQQQSRRSSAAAMQRSVRSQSVRQPAVSHPPVEVIEDDPEEPEGMIPEAPVERAQVTVRVSEHHHENMYEGSMGIAEFQGDPDAYDEMPSEHSAELFVEQPEEPETKQEGLHLDFTASSLVNAVIMQEVLQRPRNRRF